MDQTANHTPKTIGEILIEQKFITKKQLEEVLQAQQQSPHLTFGEIVTRTFNIDEGILDKIYVEQNIVPFMYAELIRRLDRIVKTDFLLKRICMDVENLITSFAAAPVWWSHRKTEARKFTCREKQVQCHHEKRSNVITGEMDITMMLNISDDLVTGTIGFTYEGETKAFKISDDNDTLKYGILFRIKEIFNQTMKH